MPLNQRYSTFLLICLAFLGTTMAFVPSQSFTAIQISSPSTPTIALKSLPGPIFSSHIESSFDTTTNMVAVSTLDPSTFLSDLLGGLLGSYAILAVPIVAALAVAGVIAFAIVSYANPADEDD